MDQDHLQSKLIIRSEAGHRSEYPLFRDRVTIGRSPTCQLVVDDNFVSRHHATIERQGNGFVLVDEGSRNGTFIGGQLLKGSHTLTDQEEFQIGNSVLRYVEEGMSDATAILPLRGSDDTPQRLRVDEQTWDVWVNGEKMEPRLSPLEFRLLVYLCRRSGTVCNRDDLAIEMWGEGGYTYDMLHHLVHRLKRRLAAASSDTVGYIVTVPGVGYELAER